MFLLRNCFGRIPLAKFIFISPAARALFAWLERRVRYFCGCVCMELSDVDLRVVYDANALHTAVMLQRMAFWWLFSSLFRHHIDSFLNISVFVTKGIIISRGAVLWNVDCVVASTI